MTLEKLLRSMEDPCLISVFKSRKDGSLKEVITIEDIADHSHWMIDRFTEIRANGEIGVVITNNLSII